MKIISIETSCDETAISILDFQKNNKFKILSDLVVSQIDIHKKYGGVYPKLAKREHTSNLFPVFFQSLKKAKLLEKRKKERVLDKQILRKLNKILDRDEHNKELLIDFLQNYKTPKLNAISATYGPGLEMALWTGFNFARALSLIFNTTLVPVNHMEGHVYASLIKKISSNKYKIQKISYPSLVVLISGGHTQLQLIKKQHSYKLLGSTLDDAVGEAYDKTARLLGIAYPGGPEISKLADSFATSPGCCKTRGCCKVTLPRPMLHTQNFDFSFSGLKTAVLYIVQSKKRLTKKFKQELSAEFENAVSDVLIGKTKKALIKYKAKNIIIGGGVAANNRLRKDFRELAKTFKIKSYIPHKKYTGDNALMIGIAGYLRYKNKNYPKRIARVNGNLKLK